MNRDDFYRTLAEFFRDEFQSDPVGVGDWLAQREQDVDQFVSEINRRHPDVEI